MQAFILRTWGQNMKSIRVMVLNKHTIKQTFLLSLFILLGLYFLTSLFFHYHFPLHTTINGVDLSLKSKRNFHNYMTDAMSNYKIKIIERDGFTQIVKGSNLGVSYQSNLKNDELAALQSPFLWFYSIWKENDIVIPELITLDYDLLKEQIDQLHCTQQEPVYPKNVSYVYQNNSFQLVEEVDGNIIVINRLYDSLVNHLRRGLKELNLVHEQCYLEPTYRSISPKAKEVHRLLNEYLQTNITYTFGKEKEELNGTMFHSWLTVDENLEIDINHEDLSYYVYTLSKKYDTVGKPREFKTSYGSNVTLEDGLYGWKINREEEAVNIVNHIKNREILTKEPSYLQTASSREGNEIGDTYLEISITKQHLWYYKEGKLLTQGSIVTGNPNRGNSTIIGLYMLNYKQKGATLRGPDYASDVTYWMPFYGNIGLHDAPWRSNFGGEIYKRNGSHGCINAPLYLAKTVYQHIEPNTPIVIYEDPVKH